MTQRPPLIAAGLSVLVPRTLDRYLITQALPPFAISLSVVLTALLLERLLVLFNDLAAEGSPLSTFIDLLADLLPHYLGLALPAALCVGVFSIVRRMSLNNEIDALMSSGVSLLRIARPFILAASVLSVLGIILYGYLQPYARYDFRAASYYAAHSGWAPHLQGMMFVSPSDTMTLTADSTDHHGSHLHKVFLRDLSANKERDITAPEGSLHFTPDRTEVRLDLWNGVILTDNGDGRPTQTHFDHTIKIIAQNDKTGTFRNRGIDERELTLDELLIGVWSKHPPLPRRHMRAELHFRLTRALAIPFIPILAVSLALIARRARSNSGLPVAAVTLIGFDHTLQLGQSIVASRGFSPWIVMWIPEVLFAVGCVALMLVRSGAVLNAETLRRTLRDLLPARDNSRQKA